ncbi:hypothetical protein EMN47_20085 [Prolixibacteraceae bacterium JC049]|nr:hypothetical protein [Prolixibacteraceae bacterium JC049]
MNTPDTEITSKGIIVIQSLNEDDKKTGDELHDDVLRYKKYLDKDTFVELYNVSTVDEFIKRIKLIEDSMTVGTIFTLHLETHGNENGIYLSSGEYVSWKLFFDIIRPINIKMCNLLILTMAMCKGGEILSYIKPEKRAPYLAFIASHRNITQDEVARGFGAFYREYTDQLDINKGINALNLEIDGKSPKKNTFWCFTSKEVFDLTFNPDRDPTNFQLIVKTKYEEHIANGQRHYTLEMVEENIRKIFKETSDKYRNHYCFIDILEK